MRYELFGIEVMRRCELLSRDYSGNILLSYSERWLNRERTAIEVVVNPKIEPIDDEI